MPKKLPMVEHIVAAARKYDGIPFVHAGRNKFGTDCVGLLIMTGHDVGLFNWDDRNYGTAVDSDRLIREIEMFCNKSNGKPSVGDILLFSFDGSPHHVGLMTQVKPEPMFIHSFQSAGRVIEERFDGAWIKWLHSTYKWKGL